MSLLLWAIYLPAASILPRPRLINGTSLVPASWYIVSLTGGSALTETCRQARTR